MRRGHKIGPDVGFLQELNSEQLRLARRCWHFIAGYLLLTSGLYIYLDLYHWEEDGYHALAGLVSWVLGYLLFLSLMGQAGYFDRGKAGGIGTFFAVQVASGIFVGVALVVLVIPGLYLLMRWLPVYARALTTEEWVGQSMRWSWNVTEAVQWPLTRAMLGPVVCYAVALAAMLSYEIGASYELSTTLADLFLSLATAWLTVLGIATFGVLRETVMRGAPVPSERKTM